MVREGGRGSPDIHFDNVPCQRCYSILAVMFCIFRTMDLEKVIKNLFDSLAFKLGTSPSESLNQEFLSAAGR